MRKALSCLAVGWVVFSVSGLAAAGDGAVTCTGKVVDAKGAPLAGATVEAFHFEPDGGRGAMYVHPVGKTVTAGDGRFGFKVLKGRVWARAVIIAHKKGLALGWANWSRRAPRELSLALGKGTVLAGTVVDKAGKPVPEAQVRAVLQVVGNDLGTLGVRRTLRPQLPGGLLTTRTDRQGRFRLTGIPEFAMAELCVVAEGKARTRGSRGWRRRPEYRSGQTDIRIVLPEEGRISGMVVDKKTGKPVPGVRLMAASSGRWWVPSGIDEEVATGKDGRFSIRHLLAGRHFVRNLRPRIGPERWAPVQIPVDVKSGETVRGIKLELSAGGVLEASVRDANTGDPIVGASVRVEVGQRSARGVQETTETRTGLGGVARMRLPPGRHSASVSAPGYRYARIPVLNGFRIIEGKTTRLPIELRRDSVLKGVLRDAAGKPVGGAEIVDGPFLVSYGHERGRFEVPLTAVWRDHQIIARLAERNLAGIEIVQEPKAEVQVTLAPGARIFGRVVDPKGKPIAGAVVGTSFMDFALAPFTLSSIMSMANREGRYGFKGLLPGRKYTLVAVMPGYGRASVQVAVPEAPKGPVQVKKIVLKLADLSISGVVVGPASRPAAGARVLANGEGQSRNLSLVWTDRKGRFTFPGLCEGRVRLWVKSDGGHARMEIDAGATDVKIELKPIPARRRPPDRPRPRRRRSVRGKRSRRRAATTTSAPAPVPSDEDF